MQIREDCFLKEKCNHCDCETFCLRNFKLNYLYDAALISREQRKHRPLMCDKDGTDMEIFERMAEISKDIVQWVKRGGQLYIYGTQSGNGKTSIALRLCQSYLNQIWPTCELETKALFVSVPTLLSELKRSLSNHSDYIDHVKEALLKADLVIFDDIATRSASDFDADSLFTFIDSRINSGKATIFTSNLTPGELHAYLGPRLASRIGQASEQLFLRGADKRSLGAYKGV